MGQTECFQSGRAGGERTGGGRGGPVIEGRSREASFFPCLLCLFVCWMACWLVGWLAVCIWCLVWCGGAELSFLETVAAALYVPYRLVLGLRVGRGRAGC